MKFAGISAADIEALDQFVIEMGSGAEAVMTATLFTMMLAVALGLKPEHFGFFKREPRHYLAGVAAQVIGLPLLTLAIVYVLSLPASIAFGMILVACCPGGTISNLLAMFARGNTALSVSMTATTSLMAAVVTPVSILFWSSLYAPTNDLLTSINFDAGDFLRQTFVILGVPIFIGMLIAWRFPLFAARVQKPLGALAAFVLILVIIASFYKYRDLLGRFGLILLPIVAIHNGAAFLLGYSAGLLTRADAKMRRALTFEVGIQNSGLGFVILITQLSGLGGAAAIAGAWGLWHIVGGSVLVGLFLLADKRAAAN